MHSIPGYDNWKLASPPEYDQVPICEACEVEEAEYSDCTLCPDCYYERHHGEIIDTLTQAMKEVQDHFDNGNQAHYNNALELIQRAEIKLEDIDK